MSWIEKIQSAFERESWLSIIKLKNRLMISFSSLTLNFGRLFSKRYQNHNCRVYHLRILCLAELLLNFGK